MSELDQAGDSVRSTSLADRYYEAFNARDLDAWLDTLDEEVEIVNDGGVLRGRTAARAHLDGILQAFPGVAVASRRVVAVCAERDLGVMVIKAVARRPWPDQRPLTDVIAGDPATAERWATSWYEPQQDDDAIERGVSFALSTPGVHAFCTPGDLGLLPRVLDAAERFTPMAANDRANAANAMADEDVIFPIPR